MRKKQGITITVMVITIVILVILTGTITFSMYSTINYSTLSAWANEITNIQDVVDEELNSTSGIDFTAGNIILDISDVEIEANQFEGETTSQDNTITLKILDLGKLGISNTNYGNLDTSTDVYAFSEKTGKVYYVQGIEVDGKMYYTLTENLRNRFGLNTTSNSLASVVFIPSVIGYTNQPITLTIKVPNTYTNIFISTSNDQIQIGTQVVKEKVYEYLINGNNIAGNYTVTVSYNDGTQTLTSSYEVNGYDVTAPVIKELTDANFVYKETSEARQEYLINLTATDESGIKVMKYAVGTIANDEEKEYFSTNKNIITDGRINLNKTTTIYTIYVEDNAGNFSTLTFDKSSYVMKTEEVPEEWAENVSTIVNDVPIPKGFVASPYGVTEENGMIPENTKNGGLVIYELTADEIANGATSLPASETQHTSRTTRNQYVWVPVEDFSKFVRQNFGQTSTTISNELGTSYWEVVVDTKTNMPLSTQNTSYMTSTTLAEVQAMYESVKEYKGFYIARYEAGLDTGTHKTSNDGGIIKSIHSKMNKEPYNYVRWTYNNAIDQDTNGAVEIARSVYPQTNTNYGVVSTLTYGVQWDRTLGWFMETKAQNGTKGITLENSDALKESTLYGNYKNNEITLDSFNDGARYLSYSNDSLAAEYIDVAGKKPADVSWLLTTGATEVARINNIYDMAGNLWEWTMEGGSSDCRTHRGGAFYYGGSGSPISGRYGKDAPSAAYINIGFRPSLYIKK